MRQIISRGEARSRGLKFYFTGVPCRRGHLTIRYTPNGTCKICLDAALKIARKKYAENNPEKVQQTKRNWAKRNKSALLLKARLRQQSIKRATPPWVRRGALLAIYKQAERISDKTGIKHSVDHIFPISGKNFCGLNVPWNLRIIPLLENALKRNRPPTEGEICEKTIISDWIYRPDHCKRGHYLSQENTKIDRRGVRLCRICQRASQNAYARKTKYAAQKKYKEKIRNARFAGATT